MNDHFFNKIHIILLYIPQFAYLIINYLFLHKIFTIILTIIKIKIRNHPDIIKEF